MKILCTNHGGKKLDEFGTSDGWITIGREYDVIGVYGRSEHIKYRIIGDDMRTPALHLSTLFSIIDPLIPANWVFNLYDSFDWGISPLELSAKGFWEQYFDGKTNAISALNLVLKGFSRC